MNRPKRRKSKDNPYTLLVINNKYYVEFKDVKNILNTVEVTEKQFEANLNNILANNISGYKFKSIRIEERLNNDKSMAWCRFSKKYAKNY